MLGTHFAVLRYLAAAYLVWIRFGLMRGAGSSGTLGDLQQARPASTSLPRSR